MFLALKAGLKNNSKAEVVICPPFVYLSEAAKVFKNQSSVKLGGQNCYWEDGGAFTPAPNGGKMPKALKAEPAPVMVRGFTGEVSAKMLKSLGVKYVIVGHSERRRYFGETDETANKKIKAALSAGLVPILCVGETLTGRKSGHTAAVLRKQLTVALKEIVGLVVVAYEPIWAIGTGKACSTDEALKAVNVLRRTLGKIFSVQTAAKIPILYGGSVNSQNAAGYTEAGLDGLLIGGASLNPKEFSAIIKLIFT